MDFLPYLFITGFFIWIIDRLVFHRVSKTDESNTDIPEKDKKSAKTSLTILSKKTLFEEFGKFEGNNLYSRHEQKTAVDLDNFDRATELNKSRIVLKGGRKFQCYGCGHIYSKSHPVYLFSCFICGEKFQRFRHFTRDLNGRVALVTGCRVKLGHQVCLKLLRAGASVIGTSRYPEQVIGLFEKYHDYEEWKERLEVYPASIDYGTNDLSDKIQGLVSYIDGKYGHLDILVNVAGRTLLAGLMKNDEKNRYEESGLHLRSNDGNSWQQRFDMISQNDFEMYYRMNTVGTVIMTQSMIPLMKKSKEIPYILNIHSRFGLMTIGKEGRHIHLNMAKVALAMFTKSLTRVGLRTDDGKSFSIQGVDPGWYSMEDFTEEDSPMPVPPIDEVDAAARVLYPVFRGFKNLPMTQRHFDQYIY